MVVGSMEVSLRMEVMRSLKEKRRPRQMLLSKLRHRFKLAAAEVDDQDTWDMLTIGIATCGPHRGPVERALRDAVDWIASTGVGEIAFERLELERY